MYDYLQEQYEGMQEVLYEAFIDEVNWAFAISTQN
jgi:hypothetical protein